MQTRRWIRHVKAAMNGIILPVAVNKLTLNALVLLPAEKSVIIQQGNGLINPVSAELVRQIIPGMRIAAGVNKPILNVRVLLPAAKNATIQLVNGLINQVSAKLVLVILPGVTPPAVVFATKHVLPATN